MCDYIIQPGPENTGQGAPIHLDIGRVSLAVPPRAADAREGSFWIVKLVVIGVEKKCGEGLLQR